MVLLLQNLALPCWAYNYCAQLDRLHIIISHSLLYYNQHKVTLRSDRKFYWMCSKCPAGQEHASSASPTYKRGSGCAFCAGFRACKCNSLQTRWPSIAAKWNHPKNDGTSDGHTASSSYPAWWHSLDRQDWQETITYHYVLPARD